MAYELHLKAETIAELAEAVQQHHKELSSIFCGEATGAGDVVAQNHVAAASTLNVGETFATPYHAAPVEVAADVTTGQVDADGLPWDERIHSSNRKMTAKGVWTRRKNVDQSMYDSVVAELRGASHYGNGLSSLTAATSKELQEAVYAQGFNTPSESVQFPPVPAQPAYTAPVEQPAPVPAFLQSVAQPAPAPVAAPTQPVYAAPAPTAPTINDLFVKLQQLSKEGVFTAQYNTDLIGALIQQFQVHISSINDIAARPDMITAAFQFIASRGN